MNHGFLSGDKVFYNSSSAIGGLPVGSYFVSRVDDNNFKLCLTRSDSLASPPIAINLPLRFGHEISKINPQILLLKTMTWYLMFQTQVFLDKLQTLL